MNARWIIIPLLALLTSIGHYAFFHTHNGQSLEYATLDLWFNLRGRLDPPHDIAIVAMDEQSYMGLDVPLNRAWPRELHARLLNKLAEYGARRVVFDVLFLDEGPSKEVDEALAASIGKLPVVLGAELTQVTKTVQSGSFVFNELLAPYDPFLDAAENIGLVGQRVDTGNSIRRFMFNTIEEYQHLLPLSRAAVEPDLKGSDLPGPSDFMNFYGPKGTIRTLSYYQILDENLPSITQKSLESSLKDKIVFVGLYLRTDSGPSQKDIFNTPFYGKDSLMFGLEIHATAAANLLDGNWIRRSNITTESLILSAVCFLLTSLMFALRPTIAMVVALVVIIAWTIGSYLMFMNHHLLPGSVLFYYFLPVTLLLSIFYYYLVTRRAQLKFQSAFELYISPQMARQLSQEDAQLKLGGEKLWATALFTDIAGFTPITEKMPAQEVSAMLNDYFTEVMDVIFDNKGTLIKFIGDAVFVIWGAPIKINNHAELAIRTALDIQRGVEKFNATQRYPALLTRIGINTGPMVVGNLGSRKRFDYTAIGDSVNLAARVEGINKYFGTDILITDAVRKDAGKEFEPLNIGAVRVVGKKEVVELYTLFMDPLSPTVAEKWSEALDTFRDRQWNAAAEKFNEVGKMEDRFKKAVELYVEQSEMHLANEPDKNWQGEIIFTSK